MPGTSGSIRASGMQFFLEVDVQCYLVLFLMVGAANARSPTLASRIEEMRPDVVHWLEDFNVQHLQSVWDRTHGTTVQRIIGPVLIYKRLQLI